jgi:hypothetical protein
MLVDQLDGRMSMDGKPGARVSVVFPYLFAEDAKEVLS